MTLKRISFLLLLVVAAACGPKKKLPEGAPTYLKDAKLWEAINENSLDFNKLELKGSGVYEDKEGSRLSFRYTLRVIKDSLIWIDLADPILGLKLVRSQLSEKEIAYYNRLDRTYFKGNSEKLAQDLGFSFEFNPLMSILSANVLQWNQKWNQVLVPQFYRINNYPQSPEDLSLGEQNLIQQNIDPQNFRPNSIEFKRPTRGELMQVQFGDYQDFDGLIFPEKINIRAVSSDENHLELDIKSLKLNQNFKTPFRIPDNYHAL